MILLFFDLLWCFFFPDVFLYLFKPFICKIKKRIHDGRRCRFWNCKNYLYCSHNQKCMNDIKPSSKPIYPFIFYVFDALTFLAMLLFGIIVMVIYNVIFRIITF